MAYLAAPAASIADVADLCRQAIGCSAIIFWQRRHQLLFTLVTVGNSASAESVDVDIPLGSGVAGTCAAENRSMIVNDLLDDDEFRAKGISPVYHRQVVLDRGWRSGIYEPIVIDNRVLGVLAGYDEQRERFKPQDQLLLRAFGDRVAARIRLADLANRYDKMLTISAAAVDVVHDLYDHSLAIRTNLDAIIGQPGIPAQAAQFAESANSSAKAVVNSLGKVRSSFRKVIKTRPHEVRLEPIMARVYEERQPIAESAAIDFRKPTCPTGMTVVSWEAELQRAITNLIDNSIHFLKDATHRRRVLRLQAEHDSKKAQIIISDNGPGIPPHLRHRVFDFGFSTRGEEGLGLGLPAVESLAEACGGHVELGSTYGEGCRIVIILPIGARYLERTKREGR